MAKDKELSLQDKLLKMSETYKTNLDVEYLDSGSIIMNMIFGKGLPMNKNIEIYSESGYGKSTIVLSICKKLCRDGHKVIYIDAEGSIQELAKSMNFFGKLEKDGSITVNDQYPNLVWSPENPDGNFLVYQVSYFEDIEEILETLVPKYDNKGNPMDSDFRLVVIDSVPALCPKEYRGDMGEKLSIASAKPGVHAKLMTNFCRKFNGYKTAYNMSFLFINQLRDNLSMSFAAKYEDNVPGGKALKYFMDVIIKLNSRGLYKQKLETGAGEVQEIVTEREVDVKAVKNKLTSGGIGLPLQVRFGIGISNIAALPYILPKKYIVNDKGETVPMLEGSGAWFTLTYNQKDENGNIIQTITQRCNGQPQLKEQIRSNYRYIYSEITPDDFKILEDISRDDE